MYHIVYGLLYLVSLLPWRVLYFISDGIYLLLYYVIGYRKKVVMDNLAIAFPQKLIEERVKIAKEFYHDFADSFIEIIKLISISKQNFRKRISSNAEVLNALYNTGQSVNIVSAHFFNWEFANLAISSESLFPFIAVYMPVDNKVFNKLTYNIRKKFGALMVAATNFRNEFLQHAKKKYALGLVADQSPGNTHAAYWIPFFNKLTAFVKGPEKTARLNNSPVLFLHFYKVKRGYYKLDYTLVTTQPKTYANGQLTKQLVQLTEDAILKKPSNYLWSHRRWKHEYNSEDHAKLVV